MEEARPVTAIHFSTHLLFRCPSDGRLQLHGGTEYNPSESDPRLEVSDQVVRPGRGARLCLNSHTATKKASVCRLSNRRAGADRSILSAFSVLDLGDRWREWNAP